MDAVVTLATVPAVVALVNVYKQFGVTGKWATLSALITGIAVTAGAMYAPDAAWQVLSEGAVLGLGAAGLYDVTKPTPPPETATRVYPSTDK